MKKLDRAAWSFSSIFGFLWEEGEGEGHLKGNSGIFFNPEITDLSSFSKSSVQVAYEVA